MLSGAAPADRAEIALDAMEKHLVSEREKLIRLLTPAFDKTPHDPGYIKGYLPGVRENGGQYTHGVLWGVRALAEMGRTERATRLLEMLSPITHGRTPEEVDVYRVGAVRDRGGRVRRRAARRARRLDMVHGIGRLDVPRGARVAARPYYSRGRRGWSSGRACPRAGRASACACGSRTSGRATRSCSRARRSGVGETQVHVDGEAVSDAIRERCREHRARARWRRASRGGRARRTISRRATRRRAPHHECE